MSKQFVEPLIAENAKLKEIIAAQQLIIDAKMAELESKCQPFIYSEDGVKVRWNEEEEGWEDVCRDCNKPWCEDGKYDEDNQWFCEDCYDVPYCDSCQLINCNRTPPLALCYKCDKL